MNVDPVQTPLSGIERPTPEKKVRAAPPQQSATSETVPKVEVARIENDPVPPVFPEHEVKVQLLTSANDMIVYQVLDKQSGVLVLQVPSAEQVRSIQQAQELLQRIASRSIGAASASVAKGEE